MHHFIHTMHHTPCAMYPYNAFNFWTIFNFVINNGINMLMNVKIFGGFKHKIMQMVSNNYIILSFTQLTLKNSSELFYINLYLNVLYFWTPYVIVPSYIIYICKWKYYIIKIFIPSKWTSSISSSCKFSSWATWSSRDQVIKNQSCNKDLWRFWHFPDSPQEKIIPIETKCLMYVNAHIYGH